MMKRKILVFISLVFINLSLIAQDKNDKYNNAIDYVACKIAKAYTKQYISNGKADGYSQKDFDKEKKSYETVIKQELDNCSIKEHLKYKDLDTLLSNNHFKDFSSKLNSAITRVRKNYDNNYSKDEAVYGILDGIYNDDKIIKITNKYSEINALKNSLKKDLYNYLNSFDEQIQKDTFGQEQQSSKTLVKKTSISLFNWIMILLALISAILSFIYSFINNNKRKESINSHISEIKKLKTSNIEFQKKLDEFEKLITDKIIEQNNAIKELQIDKGNKVISKSDNVYKSSNTVKKEQNKTFTETKKSTVLYAKNPLKDGSFNANNVNEDKSEKFYKFIVDTNNINKAEFEFYNSNYSIRVSLGSPENYLYTVCENNNPLNQMATKIITNEPGIAIKQEDKWIVTKKAKIAYE